MKHSLPVLPLKRSIKFSCVIVGIIVFAVGLWNVVPVQAATGINDTINFQGKLVDDDGLNVADSTYSVVFSLYTVGSAGTAIWTETQSVETIDGIFQVQLGSITDLPGSVDFNTDNIYLGIKVGADAEMTPRIQFAAVPYAFNAQKVAGLTVTDTTGTLTIPNGKTIQFADAFSTTGAFTLNLTTTGNTSLTLPTTGTLLTNAAATGQSITSTQSSGTVLGITDTTGLTGATTGLAVTLSGSGVQDQTGLSFNLSGATGTNTNDIVGSGGSWKVSRAGALTVASCAGCGGGSNWTLDTVNGVLRPNNNSADLLMGGTSSSSAVFKVSSHGTSPAASVSAQTSSSALIVDNKGTGDLFTASNSGASKFTITGSGAIKLGISEGANGQCLRSSGTGAAAIWGTCATGGGSGADLIQGVTQLTDATLATTTTLLGTVAATPTTISGDIWVQAQIYTRSLSATDQTLTWELREGALCSGTLLSSRTSLLTSAAAANGPAGFLSYTDINPGASSKTYAICGRSSVASGASAGGLATATVIDTNAGSGGGVNYLRLNDGAFSPVNDTADFLFGGIASNSAKFKLSANGTSPTASVSGLTSMAAMIVDNLGNGDLFTASASGLNRFVIQSNGNVGIGTTTPTALLDVAGSASVSGQLSFRTGAGVIQTTANNTLTLGGNTTGDIVLAGPTYLGSLTDGLLIAVNGGLSDVNGDINISDNTNITGNLNVLNGAFDISGSTTSNQPFGISSTVNSTTTSSQYGIQNQPLFNPGGASLNNLYGFVNLPTLSGSAITVTSMYAGYNRVDTTVGFSGTVTSAYGQYIANPSLAGGSIGSNYGLYVANQSAGGTNYNIFSAGAASTNHFAGSMGVGTTAPLAKLDVRGSNGTIPVASVAGTTAFASMIVDNSGVGDIFTASRSGGTKFVINNAGNVGIGSSNPTARLVVGANTTLDEELVVQSRLYAGFSLTADTDDDGSEIGSPYFRFTQDNDNTRGLIGLTQANNVDPLTSALTGALTDGFIVRTTNTLQLATNDAVRFTVDSSGRIGVGTTAPLATWDVRGQSGTQPVASVSGQTSNAAMIVDNNGVGDLFTASKSGATKFVITNAGNVGIGTNAPVSSLHVVNTSSGISTQGLTLQNGASAVGTGVNINFILSSSTDNSMARITAQRTTDPLSLSTIMSFATHDGASLREHMRISSTGKIGIGPDFPSGTSEATYPNATLDVRSSSGTLAVASVSGATSRAGMVVDQSGLGDIFTASKSGATHFVINNAGNVGIGTNNPTDKLDVSGLVTDTGALQGITFTLGNDAAADTVDGLNIAATSASTGDADIVHGVNIDNLTNGNATVLERGLRIGTGWSNATTDADISLDDTTPVIRLGATDNTGDLSIVDSAATPNTLVQIKDLSTQFGASVLAGAFINFNSMVAEEFNRSRSTVTNAGTDTSGSAGGALGNGGGWGAYGNGVNCTFSTLQDQINGITRMAASAAGRGCMTMIDDALNDAKRMYNVSNLPVIVMKIKPSQADANSAVYAGMGDSTDGLVTAPVNFIGFSNDNAGTLGTTWVGITRNVSTSTTVVCTGQTVSTSQFALLMIEVRSASSVRFFIDNNVSDGVRFTECGSGSATNIHGGNLAPQIHWQERVGGAASNLDLDYFRSWQDDAPTVDGLTSQEAEPLTFEESQAENPYDTQDVMKDMLIQDEIADNTAVGMTEDTLLAGLAPLSSKLDSLEDKVASMEAKLTQTGEASTSAQVAVLEPTETASSSAVASEMLETDNLSVAGLATVSANLRVQGNGLIEGILNVVDTLTVSNFIVNKLANFFGDVIFHSDVFYRGTAYFNTDTAGYVTVSKGSDKAEVKFGKPYKSEPVVNASVVTTKLSDEAFKKFVEEGICDKESVKAICEEKTTQDAIAEAMPYVIASRSTDGFTILLSQPATQDLTFSWSALAVIQAEEIVLKGGDNHDSN